MARGEFVVPTLFAEEMYDKKIQRFGPAGCPMVTDAK